MPALLRDPMRAVERIGAVAGGDIVRVDLGLFRPYLIPHPDQLQHVLIENKDNYKREGVLWSSLEIVMGNPSGANDLWWTKRKVFQQLVSAPSIRNFGDSMARTLSESVAEMADRGKGGAPLDAAAEMARIVYRGITRVLIGDRITNDQADRIGAALQRASVAMRPRLMFPFAPNRVPFVGDRALFGAVREVDDLVFPIVARARREGDDGGSDIVARLIRTQTADGRPFNAREIRDGLVSLFLAGTETSTVALTFLWTVLDSHPHVAERLQEEVDRVVGAGPVTGAHRAGLGYARNVALEMLRLYPPGWMLPRMVVDDDVIDGVRIKAGSIVVMSPYLTNRMAEFWEDPETFDPSRHERDRDRDRERPVFSYLTFGGGPHTCVGKPFFLAEVQFIVAAVLSGFRIEVQGAPSREPQLGLALRPREKVMMKIHPRAPAPRV